MAELDELFGEIEPLGQRFTDAGFSLYLVGGIVRNHLAGIHADLDDVDFTTDAEPADIKRLVRDWFEALWTQGERFGTIGGKVGDRVYEITTHRAEAYQPDSRKPSVAFSTAIIDDLSRRDFTVNAMAWRIPDRALIDPYGGQADLAAKVLRTPLDPDVSFSDDPLRMLRAARFLTRFDLAPEPALVASANEMADRLQIVSVERIRDEVHKLLRLPDPSAGLAFLLANQLTASFWPELDTAAVERIGAVEAAPDLRLAAAMIGEKPDVVKTRLQALRHSNDDTRTIAKMADAASTWSRRRSAHDDEAVRRLAARFGGELDRFVSLGVSLNLPHAAALVESISRQRESGDLDDLGPELTGEQVMKLLDLGPGPMVGEVLAELGDLRLREGRHSPEALEDHVRDFWQRRSTR